MPGRGISQQRDGLHARCAKTGIYPWSEKGVLNWIATAAMARKRVLHLYCSSSSLHFIVCCPYKVQKSNNEKTKRGFVVGEKGMCYVLPWYVCNNTFEVPVHM